jgi:membrane protease YdiL (CAAX protease family)
VTPRAIYDGEPARGWLPWGALAPVLGIAFVLVPAILISLEMERIHLVDEEWSPKGTAGLIVFLLLPFATTAALVFGWVRFVEKRPLSSIGLRAAGAAAFFRGHLVGCATILAVVLAIWLASGYQPESYAPALRAPRALLEIAVLLLCFVVQASAEEIVFRGWLLSAIARKFNVPLGVVLSSVVFCLLHFSPSQPWFVTVNLALFALFACAWALRSNDIWGVMGWHAGWNWLLATGFQLPVTGLNVGTPALLIELAPQGPDYLTGGPQGPEGSLFCGAFFLIAIVYLRRRRAA